MGEEFTAKDFRTWAGSLLALQCLSASPGDSPSDRGRSVVDAIKTIAQRLGNTPATCRKHYVHPTVIGAFLASKLPCGAADGGDLVAQETALLRLLKAEAATSS